MTGNILDIWPKQFSRCLVKGDWIEDFSFTDVNSQCFYLCHVSVVLLSLFPPKFSFLFQYHIQPSPYFSAMIVRIHSKKNLSSPIQSEAIRVRFKTESSLFLQITMTGAWCFVSCKTVTSKQCMLGWRTPTKILKYVTWMTRPVPSRPVPSHLCC